MQACALTGKHQRRVGVRCQRHFVRHSYANLGTVMENYIKTLRKIVFRIGVASCFGFGIIFPGLSYASTSTATPPPPVAAPRSVDVGIYLNNIPSVSLKEKKFQADFSIWFRWTGDDLDPLESFTLVNGHIDSKDGVVKKKDWGC